jgi:hypothetical protein
MNRKALIAMWATILLLVATWAYPPWTHRIRPEATALTSDDIRFEHKWAYLFDAQQGEPEAEHLIFRINFPRLLLVDAIIALVGAGLIVTFRDRR